MAEVISLLSSPETSPRETTKRQSVNRATSRFNDSILSDILDDPLFHVEETTKPTKRRRLSPFLDPIDCSPTKPDTAADDAFSTIFMDDSSSEDIVLEDDYPDEDFPELGATSKVEQDDPLLSGSWNDDLSDPILSSSHGFHTSTGYPKEALPRSTNVITLDDDICDLDDDGLYEDPFSDLAPSGSQAYSGRTASLLTKLLNQPKPASKNATAKKKKVKARAPSSDEDEDEDEDIPEPKPARSKEKRPAKSTTQDKAAKAQEREAARLRREKEKEEEKERKRIQKEEKDKAKRLAADIAEVNKLKVNKKESTPEMLIDVSSSFEGTSVGNQVGEFMRHLGVQMEFVSTRLPNMISWRRKVTASYNDEAGHWEPCPLIIRKEDHVLCFLTAKDFVDLAVASEADQKLGSHFQRIMQQYPGSKPIYLIEGLTAWMRKNQNIRNRAYQAAVLRHMGDGSTTEESNTSNKRSKKQPPGPPIDDDSIEDALLELQVEHNCLIYHTAAAAESAEWIKNFTEHISTIPYRQEKINVQDAAFCMDTGQVKTGADADDTYIKMLEEINRITAPVAYGVSVEYESVRELVKGMERGGPLRLQDVKKCASKSGALTESRIGPAVSRRLHKIFTCRDPTSTDI